MEALSGLRVLLFSKTAGYRHDSIPDGIRMMRELADEHRFGVHCTEDSEIFNEESLRDFDLTVWLSTAGNILSPSEKVAFESHVRGGRGFVGIHAAADTEGSWPFYQALVGARFRSHPGIHTATVLVEDQQHPSTEDLPHRWSVTDEWYDYRANPRSRVHVLMSVDESTYPGGRMGDDHPIAWRHELLGGRAWYTGLGHIPEMYSDLRFRRHVLGGLAAVLPPAHPLIEDPRP